ncbi:hypothetical protein ACQKP0_09890 [Heyndrickxia sp. NPDC080065]|uniref:hypothetical protein n=1 Tax=Heyndrickxia sp. NPDC080065 TaxID=3390568 RepID=UPI003D0801B1
MRTSLKLDESFSQLNNIERSNLQKYATLSSLNKRLERKRTKIIPFFISTCAIIIAILFTLLTVTNVFNSDSSSQLKSTHNPYVKMIKGKQITQSLISKSNSPYTFTPGQLNRSPDPVAMITDDIRWNETLKDALIFMNEIKNPPTDDPGYDLMIYINNETVIKFKIWINDKLIIFKDFKTSSYYSIKSDFSKGFGYILNHLTTLR